MTNIQSYTRGEIRRSIGKSLGILIDGEATSTTDTTSLIDITNLTGGDDEHNGKQVLIYDAAGSIEDGETSSVSDYAGSTHDATVAAFSANITDGDKYEMLKSPWSFVDLNSAIKDTLSRYTKLCPQLYEYESLVTESEKVHYAIPTTFVSLSTFEYVYTIGTDLVIHNCDDVWDELVDADVTATADTTYYKEGSASLKLVVAAGCGAGDILATEDITSLDISGCDQVAIWIYSSVALNAGDIQLLLDNTASCASPVEELDIPATTANRWTRHVISLANPYNDSAIISVGLKMVTDKGAFTLRADDIRAWDSTSKVYYKLPREYWRIVRGTTNYIQITQTALSEIGVNKQIRLTGYKNLTLPTADSSTIEIEPGWLIERVTADLLLNHSKSSSLDIDDKKAIYDRKNQWCERNLPNITTRVISGTEVI